MNTTTITPATIFQKRCDWITRLNTNPPKCENRLMSNHGTCCLGEFCLMEGVPPIPDNNEYTFNGRSCNLPRDQERELKINDTGALTSKGLEFAAQYYDYSFYSPSVPASLAEINDQQSTKHSETGLFLTNCFVEEYLFGKESYFHPCNE